MNILRAAVRTCLFAVWSGGVCANGMLRPCLDLHERPEIYAVSYGYISLVFIDNARTADERNEMRRAFMGEGVLTGISPLIVRQMLMVKKDSGPAYPWRWGSGYSMWVQEEFICTHKKPLVYDLVRNRYRDPVF